MTCRCTVNPSFFIRNVAHVYLSFSSRHATHQLHKSTRNVTPQAFSRYFLSSRAYSSATFEYGKADSEPNNSSIGPIAEISLEAIDSILAESPLKASENGAEPERDSGYETPLKSLLKDIPQRKPREDWTIKRSEVARTFTKKDTLTPGGNGDRMIGGTSNKMERNIHFDRPQAPRQDSELSDAMHRSRSPNVRNFDRQPPVDDWVPPPREPWMVEKDRAKEKYPDGYKPLKKLSPDAMAGIRALHAQMPQFYTTWHLSQEFEVSPESIRRILKSKWRPTAEEETDRQKRWFKRGESVWSRYAELGLKPPRKWRERGIGNGKPDWMVRKQIARLGQERPGPPALVTTARRIEQKYKSVDEAESCLADKIL